LHRKTPQDKRETGSNVSLSGAENGEQAYLFDRRRRKLCHDTNEEEGGGDQSQIHLRR
jgi:hypothetical protein